MTVVVGGDGHRENDRRTDFRQIRDRSLREEPQGRVVLDRRNPKHESCSIPDVWSRIEAIDSGAAHA
jgi:hypothetical protein